MTGLPNIQTAQYGDRVALEKLGSVRKTNNPAVDVQSMKDMQGGRPTESFDPMKYAMQQVKGGQQAPQQLSPTEQQHQTQFNSLAVLYNDTMKAIRVASKPTAGPLVKSLALQMMRAYNQRFMAVRGGSPFFHDV